MRSPPPELLVFLSPYDKTIIELALAVRAVMLEEAPSAVESIYDAYNAVALGYAFTGRLKDSFCHIAVYTGHVNLGFNRGAELPDPQGILQGSGKKVRHVRIALPADLERPWVRRYIRAAIRQLGGPLAPGTPGHSMVKAIYPKRRRPAPPRSDSPPPVR